MIQSMPRLSHPRESVWRFSFDLHSTRCWKIFEGERRTSVDPQIDLHWYSTWRWSIWRAYVIEWGRSLFSSVCSAPGKLDGRVETSAKTIVHPIPFSRRYSRISRIIFSRCHSRYARFVSTSINSPLNRTSRQPDKTNCSSTTKVQRAHFFAIQLRETVYIFERLFKKDQTEDASINIQRTKENKIFIFRWAWSVPMRGLDSTKSDRREQKEMVKC